MHIQCMDAENVYQVSSLVIADFHVHAITRVCVGAGGMDTPPERGPPC